MSKTNAVTYTPVVDLTFQGAATGTKFKLRAYEPVELNPSEVVHIDPRDLQLGLVEKPQPAYVSRTK